MKMPALIGMRWMFMVCALLAAAPLLADIYQYRDARGRTLLTDKPVQGMQLVKRHRFATNRGGQGRVADSLAAMFERRSRLAPLIEQAAADSQLAPELLHAVVRAESAYRSDAVSSKGAVGLMQLMPATAQRFGVSDRRDPVQSLRGGATYLRDLLILFDNDLSLALAGYNAGENAVLRHGRAIPPYPETQAYVRKVTAFFEAMRGDQVALR